MDLLFQAFVIGAIQGLSEFLPISSSAHLILAPQLLGWDDPFLNSATFDVMLHGGTLIALLVYFWRDVLRLHRRRLGGAPGALARRMTPTAVSRALLVVSVMPAALLGVAFESFFDDVLPGGPHSCLIPVIMVFGALLLWAAERSAALDRDLDRMQLGMP